MKRSFTQWALVTLLPLSALVVGCGGDDDDNGGGRGSTAGTNSGGTSNGGTSNGGKAGTSNGGTNNGGTSAGTSNGGTAGTTGGTAGSAGSTTTGEPATCQAANGSVGCCSDDGKTNYYFAGGKIVVEECADGDVCTWSGQFYACGAAPSAADPKKVYPIACGGSLTADLTKCPIVCAADADCAKSTTGKLCETATSACVECKANTDCKDAANPVCTKNACGPAPCTKDADCAKSEDGAKCDVASGSCVECTADTDCKDPQSPVCNAGSCSQCKDNTLCSNEANGPVCNEDFGICGCSKDADCAKSPNGPVCTNVILSLSFCGCAKDADCANSTKGKMCDTDAGSCVACLSDLDCKDAKAPSCTSGSCVANNKCTGDDTSEDGDDGLLGATDITPTSGNTNSVTGHSICGLPAAEADNFKFTASAGDSVTLSLDWTDAKLDLDITVVNAQGVALGADYYLKPAAIQLDFLPAGTYHVIVQRYDGETGVAAASPYTLNFSRTTGTKCATLADCAKNTGNSILRGGCNTTTGACEAIDGKGAVAKGGACDSGDDCSSKLCASTLFNTAAATHAFCTAACTKDTDCGSGQICTTYNKDNKFCTVKCTKDSECPVADLGTAPKGNTPWFYLTCDTASGQCKAPAN